MEKTNYRGAVGRLTVETTAGKHGAMESRRVDGIHVNSRLVFNTKGGNAA